MTRLTLRAAILAAILALPAVTGCAAQTEAVLTVAGEAPGAVALFVRLVDGSGAQEAVRSVGDSDQPVKLPATIHLQLARSRRVGVVVWVADTGGTILAMAQTSRCFDIEPGAQHAVQLSPAPEGWSPANTDHCRCDPSSLSTRMCSSQGPSPDGGAPVGDGAAVDVADGEALETGPPSDGGAMPEVTPSADAPPPDSGGDAGADTRDAAVESRPVDVRAPDGLSMVFVPNALFGFEMTAPDWSSTESTLARDSKDFTEGTSSIALTIPAGGIAHLRSRAFDTSDLSSARGTSISVDVFVSEAQPASANTEMWVDCPSAAVNGIYMGYRALGALRVGGWTPLTFKMPGPVASAFAAKLTDCKTWFKIAGKGLFRYDRMGFAP